MIDPKLIKITTVTPELHGGQQAGRVAQGVKVELIDGSLSVYCQIHRSQLRNKNTAIALLELGLDEI